MAAIKVFNPTTEKWEVVGVGARGPKGDPGDSSVEVTQARVDAKGVTKDTLKQRLDDDYTEVTAQLAQKLYYFNTVNEMKNENQLKVGSFVTTSGYHVGGDGGGANYLIVDTINEDIDHYETLNNGLYASLTSIKEHGYVDVRWLGAKSDLDKTVTPHTGTDVAPYFEQALAITNKNLGMRIKVIGNYYWGTELLVYTDLNLFGEHNTNRTLTGTENNPSVRKKSPSEIYINPALQQAITLEGMGNTTSTSPRSTHFTIEKLYIHSNNLTANFLRITAYGAPSRPSWVQDIQAHALNYVFFFDYVEPRGIYGTHTYNFSVRGGCDVYSVNSLVKSNARSNGNPGLGGLSIFDNSIEWMHQGAVQAKYLFGYNRIENNLMEGSANNLDITLGRGTLEVKGNYFEANRGNFTIIGSSSGISHLRMEDNYYTSDSTEYHLQNVRLSGYDVRIPKKQLAIVRSYVDDPEWFIGLEPNNQKQENMTLSYNNLTTSKLPLVDETTIQSNQFIIPMGNDFITPDIKGKLLTGSTYAPLPEGAPTIYDGDITVICYYTTEGLFFNGYYDNIDGVNVSNGYGPTLGSTERKLFRIDIFHHARDMERFRTNYRKVEGHDNVRISDVLVTVLKGSQRQEDLSKWLGVPHRNAIS